MYAIFCFVLSHDNYLYRCRLKFTRKWYDWSKLHIPCSICSSEIWDKQVLHCKWVEVHEAESKIFIFNATIVKFHCYNYAIPIYSMTANYPTFSSATVCKLPMASIANKICCCVLNKLSLIVTPNFIAIQEEVNEDRETK